MDKLFELLMRNPLIMLIVGAWVVGMVTNAVKAQKKARERRDAATRPSPMPSTHGDLAPPTQPIKKSGDVVAGMGTGQQRRLPQQRQAPASTRGAQPAPATPPPVPDPARRVGSTSPDDVAAEMRRIFGLDAKPKKEPRVESQQMRPTPVQAQAQPEGIDPRTARVRSSEPRLQSQVKSHVGEKARDHHMNKSRVGETRGNRGAIGNLGGRVKKAKKHVSADRRYPMTDLRRIIVMNEILSPPVTMRDSHRLF